MAVTTGALKPACRRYRVQLYWLLEKSMMQQQEFAYYCNSPSPLHTQHTRCLLPHVPATRCRACEQTWCLELLQKAELRSDSPDSPSMRSSSSSRTSSVFMLALPLHTEPPQPQPTPECVERAACDAEW
jgi:hypothetical protein